VWVDESGFYLLPAVQRTYAPRGQTPVLHHTLTNDHLSAISGITPDGRLYLQVQEQAFRSEGVVRFPEHLLCHVSGKLLIIWDLNPDEGIWNYLKRVELKNVCCRDLAQLRTELRKATQRLRQKKHVVKACVRQPGYI
jgi:hypothetical protein